MHLPVEILILIAGHLYYVEHNRAQYYCDRQTNLHNFCLVGRSWYSAGLAYLYRDPQLFAGSRFIHFINTVCPPTKAKKSQHDLGSFVQILDLGLLVHQSSPSQLSRLLSRTRKSLQKFVAPRVSFAVNSLASISRCQQLQILDLSLVAGEPFEFKNLKKAVSGLTHLQELSLPSSMDLCLTDSSAGKWPCRLHSMTLGGTLDSAVVKTFEWPPAIDQLIFLGYASLDLSALRIALSHPVLFSQIRRLTFLINKPGMLADDSGLNILYELPNLVYLRIPIDIFLNMAHEDLPHWNSVPLKVLELEQHVELEEDESDVTDILGQLRTIFSNVWALGLTQNTMRIFRQRVKELEDEIWSHIPDDEEMLAEGLRALEGGDIGLYII